MLNRSTTVLLFASAALLSSCGIGSNILRGSQGELAPCTGGPHCVSSVDANTDHRIPAIPYVGTINSAKNLIKNILAKDPAAAIVLETDDYLHATYTTDLLRYVDDVEFVFSQPGRIDVRSSSRIGYADMGVNRRRMEAIRQQFADLANVPQ